MKELLLLLANYPYISSNKEALIRLLIRVTDWDRFVKLINDHGIIALAAYNIKESGLMNLIPSKAMAILENGQMQSVVRNAWLAERWKEVNEILCEAKIKHLLLKGMALEHTLYESKGLRQMTDNDILIRKEEATGAWELLQKKGFKQILPKSPLHLKIMMNIHKHLPALFKDGYAVEIHSILPGERYTDENEYNRIFADALEIPVNGSKAFIPPDDVHLDFLIRHHNGHLLSGDCQIRTYIDIKLLDPDNNLEFPDNFIEEADQSYKRSYRRAAYKRRVADMKLKYRLLFLAGDIFPSVVWMKRRYKCSAVKTIIYYPHRMGKLLWLVGGNRRPATGNR